jgi:hypothetical protein
MFNDWMTLRMMSANKKGGDSNIIYELYNYTCDGTAATAINTGIYLFDTTLYPKGWDIYFDFTIIEHINDQESYLRCRNADQPWNGFTIRQYNKMDSIRIQSNSSSNSVNKASAGTRWLSTIKKEKGQLIVTIDDKTARANVAAVISPLVIGGELSNDTTQTWNTDRFSKIIIHSLIVTKKT